jgi:hypothetical protein
LFYDEPDGSGGDVSGTNVGVFVVADGWKYALVEASTTMM